MEETRAFDPRSDQVGDAQDAAGGTVPGRTAGERVRALVGEAGARGGPMVSAQAMQAKLFTVYDDAAAAPEALALVQRHLGLTLDRTWYSAEEVGRLADELDLLLEPGVPPAHDEVPADA